MNPSNPSTAEPLAQRPAMQDYGISSEPDGLLPWSFADQQLAAARNYWIGSTRPDGRPHAAPVWGVWLDGVLYFGTGAGSVKARNLAANPALVVHLESGDEVVILEGEAQWLTDVDPSLWQRIADHYAAKYPGFRPDPPSPQGPFVALRPKIAFGWLEQDFVRSATRWSFGD
ncbi:MAG: pyridoxamine 5'-phosphate oxidase family protein [Anaerolineae bacterium]